MPEKENVELVGTVVDVHYFNKKDPTDTWCAIRVEAEVDGETEKKEDDPFGIGDNSKWTKYVNCVGWIPRGELVTGLHYRMMGYYEDSSSHGRQYWPQQWIQSRPQSRHSIICYLTHYCGGIGDKVANQMCDLYGEDKVLFTLKNEPKRVANDIRGITEERAESIKLTLIELQSTQETMMELRGMLKGRGFPEKSYTAIIAMWGADAPGTIRKNPFCLMVKGIAGAGWGRCNTMWEEWGLPPDSLTRQMFGVYHIMDSHVDDHTWFKRADIANALGQLISTNVKPDQAVNEGIGDGWIVEIEHDGEKWISTSEKAEDEQIILDFLSRSL